MVFKKYKGEENAVTTSAKGCIQGLLDKNASMVRPVIQIVQPALLRLWNLKYLICNHPDSNKGKPFYRITWLEFIILFVVCAISIVWIIQLKTVDQMGRV